MCMCRDLGGVTRARGGRKGDGCMDKVTSRAMFSHLRLDRFLVQLLRLHVLRRCPFTRAISPSSRAN